VTVPQLTPGLTYSFKVRVMDAAGNFLTEYGSTATAAVPAAPAALVVGTYNVRCHNCNSGIAEEKPWTTRKPAVIETIVEQNPDVIGLQEAQQSWLLKPGGGTINKSQFEDLVDGLGSNWKLTNPARNNCVKSTTPTGCVYADQDASKGTKIIYRTDRLALVSSGTDMLPGLNASVYERYLAWAVFEQRSTGTRFFFGNTHLEPDNDAAGKTVFHNQRAVQARAIIGIIAERNPGGLPVVLVGDLASTRADVPTNAPYDVLTLESGPIGGLVDPLGNVKGNSRPVNPTVETRINTNYYSFNGWARKARKTTTQVNGVYNDYVLTTPGVRVEEFENVVNVDDNGSFVGVIPSDHNMARATLRLP
jgi:endonuclease/exonuclease/phosphatase family metal-dependent hydrolase